MGIGIVTLPKNSSSQKRPSRFISNTLWKSSAPPILLRRLRSASAAASSSSNPRLSITPKSYSKLPLSLDSPASHYQDSRNTGSTVSYVDCCGSHRVVRLTVRLRRLMCGGGYAPLIRRYHPMGFGGPHTAAKSY